MILNLTSAFTLCSNIYKLHSFNERSLCQSSSDTSSSAIAVVADDKVVDSVVTVVSVVVDEDDTLSMSDIISRNP